MSTLQIVTTRIYSSYNVYRHATQDLEHYVYYKYTTDNDVSHCIERVQLSPHIKENVISYVINTGVTRYSDLTKVCITSTNFPAEIPTSILEPISHLEYCTHYYRGDHSQDMIQHLNDLITKENEEHELWHYTI